MDNRDRQDKRYNLYKKNECYTMTLRSRFSGPTIGMGFRPTTVVGLAGLGTWDSKWMGGAWPELLPPMGDDGRRVAVAAKTGDAIFDHCPICTIDSASHQEEWEAASNPQKPRVLGFR